MWSDCLYRDTVKNFEVATLNCVPVVFQRFIFAALMFAGTAAVIIILFSGFKFLFSGGDAKQIDEARKTLTFAIIGLLIVLSAFFIISLLGHITGVTCIEIFGFSQCE